jgi:hypothetical protein
MQRNGLAPGCEARVAMRDIMSTKLTTLAAAGALCSAHWRLRLLARRPHWVKPQVLRPTHRFLRVYFVNTTKLGQPNRKRHGPRRRHSGPGLVNTLDIVQRQSSIPAAGRLVEVRVQLTARADFAFCQKGDGP